MIASEVLITREDLRRMIGRRALRSVMICCLSLLSSCAQRVTLYSRDGESWEGKWRHAREQTGLMQIIGSSGETLVGTFKTVSRQSFLERYEKTFGMGAIAAVGPDVSAFGNAFAGMLGGSRTLLDVAYGENFNPASEASSQTVAGPLFYWTAKLQGDKRTTMDCFLIGSAYTGHGLGRCKGTTGKEYTVEF
jgi:hypothetical protein